MLTLKLRRKNICNKIQNELVDKFCFQYTGLFYHLYNNPELLEDASTRKELLKKFDLFDVSMYDFCVSDVKTKLNQRETIIKKKEKQIIEIENLLKN